MKPWQGAVCGMLIGGVLGITYYLMHGTSIPLWLGLGGTTIVMAPIAFAIRPKK